MENRASRAGSTPRSRRSTPRRSSLLRPASGFAPRGGSWRSPRRSLSSPRRAAGWVEFRRSRRSSSSRRSRWPTTWRTCPVTSGGDSALCALRRLVLDLDGLLRARVEDGGELAAELALVQVPLELPFVGDRDRAGLLGDHEDARVGLLRQSQRGAVPRAENRREAGGLAQGKDAAGRGDLVASDHDGAVVERRVGREDRLQELLR